LLGHENDPRYLQTSAPESALLVATFEAQLGDCSGPIRLALPLPTLEPLLQKIRAELRPPTETPTNQSAMIEPPTWNPALDQVSIPLNAVLPGPKITGRELHQLKVGDVLELPVDAADLVQLRLGGVARFQARLGTRDEHWAVEVLNALKSRSHL
jgi:flagellar motor switch protein FliM